MSIPFSFMASVEDRGRPELQRREPTQHTSGRRTGFHATLNSGMYGFTVFDMTPAGTISTLVSWPFTTSVCRYLRRLKTHPAFAVAAK